MILQRALPLSSPGTSERRLRRVSGVILALSVAATITVWLVARHSEDAAATRSRHTEATRLISQLASGYAQTEAVLATANALVDTTGAVDRQRFATFAQVLLAPGSASGVSYERVVSDADRASFEASSGLPIVDRSGDGTFVPAARRPVYFPVTAVEPTGEPTRRVLGFDLAQDPSRGNALQLAQQTGTARTTPVLKLAPSDRTGFLIVQPLKRPDGEVAGFVAITYTGDQVGQSIATSLRPGTRFRISDGGVVLFQSNDAPRGGVREQLPIGGRTWLFEMDIPRGPTRTLSTALLLGGGGLTALLALAAALSQRNQRMLLRGRHQVTRERDLAAALALAVTTDEVLTTAAQTIPEVSMAQAVSIGLLEGHELQLRHSPNLDAALAQKWSVIPMHVRTPFSDAVRSSESIIYEDTAPINVEYPNVEFNRIQSARAIVCNPLVVGQHVIGAIAFGFDRVQHFEPERLRWFDQITAMVAGALERSQLYDTQTHVALTLQRDLLPGALPAGDIVAMSVAYRPGVESTLVGGDWYDAFELGDGRLAVTIGDVAGSGVRAAASMGKLRHMIRACAGAYKEPAIVLHQANELVCEGSPSVFATACYLTIDPSGNCRFALAGHLPPLIVDRGDAVFVPGNADAPLGARPRSGYREFSFRLEPGASVVLYTDGLVERRGEHIDASLARLRDTAHSIGADLDADTLASAMGVTGRDDVVVLVVNRVPEASQAPQSSRPLIDTVTHESESMTVSSSIDAGQH